MNRNTRPDARSRVNCFIQNFALQHDLSEERVAFHQTLVHILGRANQQVNWERRRNLPANPDRLVVLVARRHYDENVHVVVGVGRSIRMGADDYLVCRG
jgi:hypothetical protein